MGDEDLEFTLLNKYQSKVYPIPPAVSADGHRASDWKESIWIGRCKIVGKGKTLTIKLVDSATDSLFAQCVIPNGEHEKYVEPVVDSSRYFVLKITNDQRHAFIGFGFSDRNDAFDFKSCLNDFKTRFVERDSGENTNSLIDRPAKDLSLKDGQTITVNLKGIGVDSKKRSDVQGARQNVSSPTSSAFPLLAPPPKFEKLSAQAINSSKQQLLEPTVVQHPDAFRPVPPRQGSNAACTPVAQQCDDFADFQSAPAPSGTTTV